MNEQFKLLAEQAGIHDDVCRMCPIHEIEKFAKLIVQECIDTYDHWATHSMDKTAFVVARTHVKEHFGIEQ
jgi:HD superfamily phosphohydrolase YqeK